MVILNAIVPSNVQVLAADASWSQTFFNGVSDGTYSSTVPTNNNNDVSMLGAGAIAYPYKKDIIFNTTAGGANVASSQTNFPVVVNINASSWPNASDRQRLFGTSGSDYNPGGKRVRFYDADGTTVLNYHVSYFSRGSDDQSTSGEAVYWVKVPQVDGNSSTDKITIAYGSDPYGADQNATTVWSDNYAAVYLFADGSGNTITDESGYGKNLTSSNITWGASGPFSKSAVPIGIATAGSAATAQTTNYAMELMVAPQAGSVPGAQVLVLNGAQTNGWGLYLLQTTPDPFKAYMPNVVWQNLTTNVYPDGNTHHLFITRNTTTTSGWIDGVSKTVANSTNTPNVPTDLTVQAHATPLYYLAVSKVVRTADYQKLSYQSKRKTNYVGDSWLSMGSEVSLASGTYVSSAISPSGLYGNWGALNYTKDVSGAGTVLTVDVLNGSDNAEILTDVASGTNLNLSTITYPSLKLRANLSTSNFANLPSLQDWSIAYLSDVTSPTAPTNLSLSGSSATSVTVTWNASTDSESGIERYEVQKSTDGTAWDNAVNPDPLTATSYTYNGLSANTKYYFRVRAKDFAGLYSGYVGSISADANTAGLWKMDEATGITARDTSSSEHNGYFRDTQINAVDSTSGWAVQTGALTLNNSTFKEGTGAVNLTKTSTASSETYAYTTINVTNMTNRYLSCWFYVKDEATLSKIYGADLFIYAPNVSNRKSINFTNLKVGWNLLTMDIGDGLGHFGSPNFTNVQWIRVDANGINAAQTWSAGDIIFDEWFMSEKKIVDGRFGKAINFDGQNDYVAAESDSHNLSTGSIEGWVKLTAFPAAESWATVFSKSAGNHGYRLLVGPSGNVSFQISDGIGSDTATAPDGTITLNNWFHLVGTWESGGGVCLYVNGTKIAGPVGSRTVSFDGTKNLNFGRNVSEWYLTGLIDEVRLSTTVRSAEDIAAYYALAVNEPQDVYTLNNVPTLDSPTTPTNDARPTITNSLNPDASFANMTVKLYDGETNVATTKANGSGVFSFGDNKLLNSSFETDGNSDGLADNWSYAGTVAGTVTKTISTDSVLDLKSQRLTYTGLAGDSNKLSYIYQSINTFNPGDTATFSFYSKGSCNSITCRAYLKAYDAGLNSLGNSTLTVFTPTSTFAKTTLSWTIPANATRVDAIIQQYAVDSGDSFDLYFDSAKVDNYSQNLTEGEHQNLTAKVLNGDGIESDPSNAVTVAVDTSIPATPANFSLGNQTSSNIPLTWTASTDSDGTTGYLVERAPDSSGNPGSWTELNSGNCANLALSATGCTDSSLSANTKYWYRLRSFDTNSGITFYSSYTSSLSKTTLTEVPTLNTPTSPTNNNKPPISNSNNPNPSLANSDITLYYGGDNLVATTTADENGSFVFVENNYSAPFADGNWDDVRVTASNLNGEPSAFSDSVTIQVDTVDPTAPTTRTAAKVENDSGADIDDGAWNGHNSSDTVYFAWSGATDSDPSSFIKRYWVYFGPNSGAVPRTEGQATADSTVNLTKTLGDPVSGTDYYLRIQTEDNAGNISSDAAIPTLFVYKFDNTAPSAPTPITPDPAAWSTNNSFNFAWANWTEVDSGLDYYLYSRKTSPSSENYEDFDLVNRKVTDVTDPVNLSGVEALYNGVNWLRVYAADKAGNVSLVYATVPYFYSGTVTGPTVTPNPAYNTENSFSFTITKPAEVTATGYYCGVSTPVSPTNSTYIKLSDLPKAVTINGKTTNASVSGDDVSLSAFAAARESGENHLYCATENEAGNIGWSTATSAVFTVNATAPTAPNTVSVSDSSNRGTGQYALTLMWLPAEENTPDFSYYVVERSTNGTDFSERATLDNTNTGYLDTGLTQGQAYYYRIRSKDNIGNLSDPTEAVTKIPTGKYTEPPTLTSTPSSSPKATSVTISWTTSRTSNSIVQYGSSLSYGQEASKSTEEVTDHEVEILGLTPGTTYHFRVQSLDLARDYDPASAFSQDYTFTTSQAPGISAVEISEIRLSTAIITWKTTSSSTSTIHYGTNTNYGKTYVDNSASQTTTHTVKLTNLSDSTTYNFKIVGTDIEGNNLSSDNYVFTTLTYPRLSGLKVEQLSNTATSTIKVSFESNVPTTSQVTVSGNGGKEAATYQFKNKHELVISGLRDNTPYTITARGRDEYGNEAQTVSTSYKTDFDTRPPHISNITVESSILGYGTEAKGQLVISWVTDEPASSQVEYAAGVAGAEYTSKTQEDTSLTENHVVIISDLKPSAPYHFRAVSKDASENTSKSQDNSVLTEQANESIIDLIIKSLENTIGWIFAAFGSNNR